jgi:quinol monooxygenase YgiN
MSKLKFTDNFTKQEAKPFLFSINEEGTNLYILHRDFPQFLIQVIPELPMRFVIVETYCDISDEELFNHPSIQEAKDFMKSHGEKFLPDLN